jgi:two-component system response regulator AlgR
MMRNGMHTVLIADDEAPARARLRDMLADAGGWTVLSEAANGAEVLQQCQEQLPDVVLLDIRMPGMDGLEAAAHLARLPLPPAVVFTTAFDEYAVKAFDAHALGYLLKPVRRERLLRALEHAARISRMQVEALTRDNPELGARQNIPVTLFGTISLIPVDSIIAFVADQKYVRLLHNSDGAMRESLIDEPLKSLGAEFSAAFVRTHRNSLVRVAAIDRLTHDEAGHYAVHLRGLAEPLPVSRRHLGPLRQRLKQ